MTETQIVILIVAALALLAGGWWLALRRRRQDLQAKFGPEYERMVEKLGSRGKAEDELDQRRKRVDKLELRPLAATERTHFGRQWAGLQARFVDQPGEAVSEAHRLLTEVMRARGFPAEDVEHSRADLSVALPHLVENYRQARAVADRNRRGEASTEDLRQAIVHYRALFQALLAGDVSDDEPGRKAGAG